MVEDAPAAAEHGSLKTCHGSCSRNGSERGTFQRNSLSVSSMSSTLTTGRSYGARVRGTFHGAAPVCSAP
jgi:hypothetical protein